MWSCVVSVPTISDKALPLRYSLQYLVIFISQYITNSRNTVFSGMQGCFITYNVDHIHPTHELLKSDLRVWLGVSIL